MTEPSDARGVRDEVPGADTVPAKLLAAQRDQVTTLALGVVNWIAVQIDEVGNVVLHDVLPGQNPVANQRHKWKGLRFRSPFAWSGGRSP